MEQPRKPTDTSSVATDRDRQLATIEDAHAEIIEALDSPTSRQDAVGRGFFRVATTGGLTLMLAAKLGPAAGVVAAFVGEIIEHLIPRLREQRLNEVLTALTERLRDVERDQIESRFRHEEFIALFEDGLQHAARATSKERIEQVAAILARGLTDDEARLVQHRHVLSLLTELNDIEVVVLRAYARHPSRDKAFRDRHAAILEEAAAPFTVTGASDEARERKAIYESFKVHLMRLGLTKEPGRDVTALGRLLLITAGLLRPDER